MGLFSGGNSKSSNTTNNINTENYSYDIANENINLSDNEGVAVTGDNSSYSYADSSSSVVNNYSTDGGAFDFASESQALAFELGNESVDGAFNLSANIVGASIDGYNDIAETAFNSNNETIGGAFDLVEHNTDSAFDFSRGVVDTLSDKIDQAVQLSESSLDFAANATKPDGGQAEGLIKTVMIGAAVMVGAFAFVARK